MVSMSVNLTRLTRTYVESVRAFLRLSDYYWNEIQAHATQLLGSKLSGTDATCTADLNFFLSTLST